VSAGAHLARDLLGPQDWKHAPQVVFPTIVLALFVADATRVETKSTRGATGTTGFPVLAMIRVPVPQIGFADGTELATGLCSAISGFVDSTLTSIFNVLRIHGLPPFWSLLLNVAVSFLQGAVGGFITVLTKPIVGLLQTAAGILATATMVVSYLRPWKVTVQAEPASNRFAVGTEAPIGGRLKLQVTTSGEGLDWPPAVLDCARSLGQDLTTVAFDDSKISWHVDHGMPEFADKISADTVVAKDKTAYFTYHTQNESVEAAKGAPKYGSLGVTATLERGAVRKLADLINGIIFDQLPGWIADIVKPYFAPKTAAAINALAPFLHAQNGTAVAILYHEKIATPPPVVLVSPTARAQRVDPCSLIDGGTAAILGATFVVGPIQSSKEPGTACMAYGADIEKPTGRVGGGVVLIAVITQDDLQRRANPIAVSCMQMGADTVPKCHEKLQSLPGGGGASAVKNGVLVTAGATFAGSNDSSIAAARAVLQHALKLMDLQTGQQ